MNATDIVTDAKTLLRFWEQYGDTTQKFAAGVHEISRDRNEVDAREVWTVRMTPMLGRAGYSVFLLLTRGSTVLQMLGNCSMYEPSFTSIFPEVFGAFFAALGPRLGYAELLSSALAEVNRGRHIGEVWLKLEELFPQAVRFDRAWRVHPVTREYWKKVKSTVPFSETWQPDMWFTSFNQHADMLWIDYGELTLVAEGAFLWTTRS